MADQEECYDYTCINQGVVRQEEHIDHDWQWQSIPCICISIQKIEEQQEDDSTVFIQNFENIIVQIIMYSVSVQQGNARGGAMPKQELEYITVQEILYYIFIERVSPHGQLTDWNAGGTYHVCEETVYEKYGTKDI